MRFGELEMISFSAMALHSTDFVRNWLRCKSHIVNRACEKDFFIAGLDFRLTEPNGSKNFDGHAFEKRKRVEEWRNYGFRRLLQRNLNRTHQEIG